MAKVQLRRNSFARETLYRESLPNARPGRAPRECAWCGSTPRTLYAYWWESDGLIRLQRPDPRGYPSDARRFCDIGCAEAFGVIV